MRSSRRFTASSVGRFEILNRLVFIRNIRGFFQTIRDATVIPAQRQQTDSGGGNQGSRAISNSILSPSAEARLILFIFGNRSRRMRVQCE